MNFACDNQCFIKSLFFLSVSFWSMYLCFWMGNVLICCISHCIVWTLLHVMLFLSEAIFLKALSLFLEAFYRYETHIDIQMYTTHFI